MPKIVKFKVPSPEDVAKNVVRKAKFAFDTAADIGRGAVLQYSKGKIYQGTLDELENGTLTANGDYVFADLNGKNLTEQRSYFLDTPIYDRLLFPTGSYIDLDGREISYPAMSIDTAVFRVSQRKNIVKTPIQGRNGTVKEYISDGDWEIDIRGHIDTEKNEYPLYDLSRLVQISKVPQQVKIQSGFLNRVYDVFYVVIEEVVFNQKEGYVNSVPFTIKASSDYDLDVVEFEVSE